MVPGLFQSEMERRRVFYATQANESDTEDSLDSCSSDDLVLFLEERGQVRDHKYPDVLRHDDDVSVCLLLSDRPPSHRKGHGKKSGKYETILDRRYLLCPAQFPISLLKKFIKGKFELSETHEVNVYHREDVLSDECTLLDVCFIYKWNQSEPLRLYYTVTEELIETRYKVHKQYKLSYHTHDRPSDRTQLLHRKRGTKRKSNSDMDLIQHRKCSHARKFVQSGHSSKHFVKQTAVKSKRPKVKLPQNGRSVVRKLTDSFKDKSHSHGSLVKHGVTDRHKHSMLHVKRSTDKVHGVASKLKPKQVLKVYPERSSIKRKKLEETLTRASLSKLKSTCHMRNKLTLHELSERIGKQGSFKSDTVLTKSDVSGKISGDITASSVQNTATNSHNTNSDRQESFDMSVIDNVTIPKESKNIVFSSVTDVENKPTCQNDNNNLKTTSSSHADTGQEPIQVFDIVNDNDICVEVQIETSTAQNEVRSCEEATPSPNRQNVEAHPACDNSSISKEMTTESHKDTTVVLQTKNTTLDGDKTSNNSMLELQPCSTTRVTAPTGAHSPTLLTNNTYPVTVSDDSVITISSTTKQVSDIDKNTTKNSGHLMDSCKVIDTVNVPCKITELITPCESSKAIVDTFNIPCKITEPITQSEPSKAIVDTVNVNNTTSETTCKSTVPANSKGNVGNVFTEMTETVGKISPIPVQDPQEKRSECGPFASPSCSVGNVVNVTYSQCCSSSNIKTLDSKSTLTNNDAGNKFNITVGRGIEPKILETTSVVLGNELCDLSHSSSTMVYTLSNTKVSISSSAEVTTSMSHSSNLQVKDEGKQSGIFCFKEAHGTVPTNEKFNESSSHDTRQVSDEVFRDDSDNPMEICTDTEDSSSESEAENSNNSNTHSKVSDKSFKSTNGDNTQKPHPPSIQEPKQTVNHYKTNSLGSTIPCTSHSNEGEQIPDRSSVTDNTQNVNSTGLSVSLGKQPSSSLEKLNPRNNVATTVSNSSAKPKSASSTDNDKCVKSVEVQTDVATINRSIDSNVSVSDMKHQSSDKSKAAYNGNTIDHHGFQGDKSESPKSPNDTKRFSSTSQSFAKKYRCPTKLWKQNESKSFLNKSDRNKLNRKSSQDDSDPYMFTADDNHNYMNGKTSDYDDNDSGPGSRNALAFLEEYVNYVNKTHISQEEAHHIMGVPQSLGSTSVIANGVKGGSLVFAPLTQSYIPLKHVATSAVAIQRKRAKSDGHTTKGHKNNIIDDKDSSKTMINKGEAYFTTLNNSMNGKNNKKLGHSKLGTTCMENDNINGRNIVAGKVNAILGQNGLKRDPYSSDVSVERKTNEKCDKKIPPLKLKLPKSCIQPIHHSGKQTSPERKLSKSVSLGNGEDVNGTKSPQEGQPRIFLRISKANIPSLKSEATDCISSCNTAKTVEPVTKTDLMVDLYENDVVKKTGQMVDLYEKDIVQQNTDQNSKANLVKSIDDKKNILNDVFSPVIDDELSLQKVQRESYYKHSYIQPPKMRSKLQRSVSLPDINSAVDVPVTFPTSCQGDILQAIKANVKTKENQPNVNYKSGLLNVVPTSTGNSLSSCNERLQNKVSKALISGKESSDNIHMSNIRSYTNKANRDSIPEVEKVKEPSCAETNSNMSTMSSNAPSLMPRLMKSHVSVITSATTPVTTQRAVDSVQKEPICSSTISHAHDVFPTSTTTITNSSDNTGLIAFPKLNRRAVSKDNSVNSDTQKINVTSSSNSTSLDIQQHMANAAMTQHKVIPKYSKKENNNIKAPVVKQTVITTETPVSTAAANLCLSGGNNKANSQTCQEKLMSLVCDAQKKEGQLISSNQFVPKTKQTGTGKRIKSKPIKSLPPSKPCTVTSNQTNIPTVKISVAGKKQSSKVTGVETSTVNVFPLNIGAVSNNQTHHDTQGMNELASTSQIVQMVMSASPLEAHKDRSISNSTAVSNKANLMSNTLGLVNPVGGLQPFTISTGGISVQPFTIRTPMNNPSESKLQPLLVNPTVNKPLLVNQAVNNNIQSGNHSSSSIFTPGSSFIPIVSLAGTVNQGVVIANSIGQQVATLRLPQPSKRKISTIVGPSTKIIRLPVTTKLTSLQSEGTQNIDGMPSLPVQGVGIIENIQNKLSETNNIVNKKPWSCSTNQSLLNDVGISNPGTNMIQDPKQYCPSVNTSTINNKIQLSQSGTNNLVENVDSTRGRQLSVTSSVPYALPSQISSLPKSCYPTTVILPQTTTILSKPSRNTMQFQTTTSASSSKLSSMSTQSQPSTADNSVKSVSHITSLVSPVTSFPSQSVMSSPQLKLSCLQQTGIVHQPNVVSSITPARCTEPKQALSHTTPQTIVSQPSLPAPLTTLPVASPLFPITGVYVGARHFLPPHISYHGIIYPANGVIMVNGQPRVGTPPQIALSRPPLEPSMVKSAGSAVIDGHKVITGLTGSQLTSSSSSETAPQNTHSVEVTASPKANGYDAPLELTTKRISHAGSV